MRYLKDIVRWLEGQSTDMVIFTASTWTRASWSVLSCSR